MSNRYLIGLMGAARAGKDTVAARLVETAGFERRGFADALKAMCREALQRVPPPVGLREMDYYDGDGVDWTCVERKTHFGRWFLQVVGTDIVRRVDLEYWVNALVDHLDLANADGRARRTVIADVRFSNEYQAIKKRGGVIWRVERTGWEEDATVAAHASEQAWRSLVPDEVLSAPSGDIAALRRATDAAWGRLQGKVTRDAYRA